MNKTARALLAVWLSLATSHLLAQSVLTNGSFEQPFPPGPSGEVLLVAGSTNLPGWTIGGAGSLWFTVDPLPGSFRAIDGRQFVDFSGSSSGVTLSQTFATITGETYEVSFVVGQYQAPHLTFRLEAAILEAGGAALTNVQVVAPQALGWSAPTRFRFTATTATSTLRFGDTSGTVNIDLLLDAVTVERTTPHLTIAASHVRVCWESHTNRAYQLQYRSDLTTNIWTDLGTPYSGTGATDCTVQPIADPQRFYRVVLLP